MSKWLSILLLSLSLIPPLAGAADTSELSQHLSHESSFSLIVLSDTQDYADRSVHYARKKWGKDCTSYFGIQTAWTRKNAEKLRIKFLLHTGDITQMDQIAEWQIAKSALSQLDGVIPYAISQGNHDMGCLLDGSPYGKTALNRDSHLNDFFPVEKIKTQPWFNRSLDQSLANASYLFEESGLKFLIVSLEFKPRDTTLAWANKVVSSHPDRQVIIITHGYLNPEEKGNSYSPLDYKVTGNGGKKVWDKFISQHKNIFLVLCGHTQGEGRRTDKGIHGNEVHQLLADYRHLENGGASWLRQLIFQPEQNRIEVFTYNPALNKYMNGPQSRFALHVPMSALNSKR